MREGLNLLPSMAKFQAAKIKNKQAVVSLPEDEVISRLVRLPPLKDSDLFLLC